MPAQQLRTAHYDDHDRKRLGDAVKRARRAAGFRSQKAMADAMAEASGGLVGVRSISSVETGEPLVGERVLEDVGRFLGRHFATWDEDTPRKILEGMEAPPLTPVEAMPPALPVDDAVTWERFRREMKYFRLLFKDAPEDYRRLRDLLTLSSQLDAESTESGHEDSAQG